MGRAVVEGPCGPEDFDFSDDVLREEDRITEADLRSPCFGALAVVRKRREGVPEAEIAAWLEDARARCLARLKIMRDP